MERHCCRNQELNEFGGQDGGSGCLDVLAEAGKLGFDWVWLLWMRVLLAAVCFVVLWVVVGSSILVLVAAVSSFTESVAVLSSVSSAEVSSMDTLDW